MLEIGCWTIYIFCTFCSAIRINVCPSTFPITCDMYWSISVSVIFYYTKQAGQIENWSKQLTNKHCWEPKRNVYIHLYNCSFIVIIKLSHMLIQSMFERIIAMISNNNCIKLNVISRKKLLFIFLILLLFVLFSLRYNTQDKSGVSGEVKWNFNLNQCVFSRLAH